MARVFLSYSRDDQEVVKDLVSIITSADISIWHDTRAKIGHRWWKEILKQIQDCDVFVYAVSEASLSSKACTSEYEYARDLNRHVIPVLLEKVREEKMGDLSKLQGSSVEVVGMLFDKARRFVSCLLTRSILPPSWPATYGSAQHAFGPAPDDDHRR